MLTKSTIALVTDEQRRGWPDWGWFAYEQFFREWIGHTEKGKRSTEYQFSKEEDSASNNLRKYFGEFRSLIKKILWEPDESGFWVLYGPGLIRRLA